MVAGPPSPSRKRTNDLVELSDTDPFTVAPFVDKFFLEFQKFHHETSQQLFDTAISFNGKALVDNLYQELEKFHQHASRHATVAVDQSKAVMDKFQTDLVQVNQKASKHSQSHGRAMVDKVQAEIQKIQGQASNMTALLSDIMSKNACLALHPRSRAYTVEMDVDDSRDPMEASTDERNGYGGSVQVQCELENELERIKRHVTTITLTTEAATKLFATKSFLDGEYAENPNLWKVIIDSGEWLEPLPLAELEHMEIHIGGNFFTRINHQNLEGFVEDNKPGEVAFCIDDLIWVNLSLSGYKARDMESLKAVASNMVLRALLDLTSTSIRFRVEDLQFISASIPGLMSFVAMDREAEQERQKELKAHALLGEIILIMERNEGGNTMKELVARGSAILDALLEVGGEHSVDSERLGKIVPLMMAAQNVGVQDLAEVARISKYGE